MTPNLLMLVSNSEITLQQSLTRTCDDNDLPYHDYHVVKANEKGKSLSTVYYRKNESLPPFLDFINEEDFNPELYLDSSFKKASNLRELIIARANYNYQDELGWPEGTDIERIKQKKAKIDELLLKLSGPIKVSNAEDRESLRVFLFDLNDTEIINDNRIVTIFSIRNEFLKLDPKTQNIACGIVEAICNDSGNIRYTPENILLGLIQNKDINLNEYIRLCSFFGIKPEPEAYCKSIEYVEIRRVQKLRQKLLNLGEKGILTPEQISLYINIHNLPQLNEKEIQIIEGKEAKVFDMNGKAHIQKVRYFNKKRLIERLAHTDWNGIYDEIEQIIIDIFPEKPFSDDELIIVNEYELVTEKVVAKILNESIKNGISHAEIIELMLLSKFKRPSNFEIIPFQCHPLAADVLVARISKYIISNPLGYKGLLKLIR